MRMSTGYEPSAPTKPGNGPPIEVEKRADVRRVAHVRGEEAVEGQRQAAGDEGDEPAHERGEDGEDRPERQPDEVRQREEEPEEDEEPRPRQVVLELELDRMLGELHRAGEAGSDDG